MKKPKILFLQFRTDESLGYERNDFQKYLSRAKIHFLNVFEDKIESFSPKRIKKDFNGIILGGSGEFFLSKPTNNLKKVLGKIKPLIDFIFKEDFPALGICFGHQILGSFLGAKVISDPQQKETGSFSVFLTKEGKKDSLFNGIPQKFNAQFGHKDSLESLPPGAVLLGKTKKCKISAFCYKNNIYGVQFHPEMGKKEMLFRLGLYPEYLGKKKLELLKKEIRPSPYASKVIINFLNLARGL